MHYLDHAATTPIHADVQQCIQQAFADFGNPSSLYQIGRQQKNELIKIKRVIKQYLNASQQDEVIFTASGSEANNLVIQSFIHEYASQGGHFITSAIEHSSVLKTMKFAEKMGCEVTYLPVTKDGVVSVEDLKQHLKETTKFVSIMMINNETGARQPIEEIAKLLKEKNIPFHTDAVQALSHEKIHVDQIDADYISFSGHKIQAPKGIGFLYKRSTARLSPFIIGGGQENGYRAGTENIPYIMGLAKAIELNELNRDTTNTHVKILGDYLMEQLHEHEIEFQLNGHSKNATSHIFNIWLPHLQASRTIIFCDLAQVAISAGSACSAGSLEPSPVLTAMFGTQSQRVGESIRLSFGSQTTTTDIDAFIQAILPLTNKQNIN